MYSFDRSSQLRSLTLAYFEIKPSALTKVIKKLPLLEELHLIMPTDLNPKDCETIGISCPMLRSFTYSNCSNSWGVGVVEDMTWQVVAIGKAMPNLRHLRLCQLHFENKGLEVILNGCPHLESLELSGCSGLDLQGDLGKRCSEQIKDLRLHPKSLDQVSYIFGQFGPCSDQIKDLSIHAPNLESLHLRHFSGLHLQGGLGKRCSDQIKDLSIHACEPIFWGLTSRLLDESDYEYEEYED